MRSRNDFEDGAEFEQSGEAGVASASDIEVSTDYSWGRLDKKGGL